MDAEVHDAPILSAARSPVLRASLARTHAARRCTSVELPHHGGNVRLRNRSLKLDGTATPPGGTPTQYAIEGTLEESTLRVAFTMGSNKGSATLRRTDAQAVSTASTPGTVLITGANRGLGLEFARQYAERGWTVVATLGDMKHQTLGSLEYATFEEVMAVNVYGALAVAEAFTEHVAASTQKKIVSVTSRSGAEGAARQARPPDVVGRLISVIDGLTPSSSGEAPRYFDGSVLPW